MSAPNPVSAPASDLRPSEPSMEEILASIRRIIADDHSFPDRAPVADEPAPASVHVLHSDVGPSDPAPDAEPEVPQHSIGEDGMHAQGIVAAPQFASPAGPVVEPVSTASSEIADDAPVATERGDLHAVPHEGPSEARMPDTPPAEAIPTPIEAATIAVPRAVEHAFDDRRDEAGSPAAVPPQAAPLFSAATNSSVASAFNVLAASRLADNSEDLLGLAREMIRPLLRAWLDENLPGMVERMVRDEIERVARGGH